MHILQKWLISEQDFKHGLALFKASGGSSTWLNLFEKLGESTYTRVELYKQIDALLKSIEVKVMPPAPTEKIPSVRPSEKDDVPDIIKKVREERKMNHKFATQLHNSLVLHVEHMITRQTPIVDAKATVFELRNYLSKMDEAWSITDAYDEDQTKLPVEKKGVKNKKIFDINHAADRRRTLKVYLSPSYLKRKPESDREKFIQEVKEELAELELLIAENESTIQLQ